MAEPSEAGTHPGDKSPAKLRPQAQPIEIPETGNGEASDAVQATPAPPVPASLVRSPARIASPAQPPKTHSKSPNPVSKEMPKAVECGPTVKYDKNGTALFPTRAVVRSRLKELYPDMDGLTAKSITKDRPRWNQYNKLNNLVFNHRVLLERMILEAGPPHLGVEHHSELAKGVFAKVTAWRRARDHGHATGRLPLHEEILAIKLLSNDFKHHDLVLQSLAGTSQEYLLEPIPPAGTSGKGKRETKSTSSTALVAGSLIAQVQDNVSHGLGQSLAEALNSIRKEQDESHKTMKALRKAVSDVEKLQAKQDSTITRALALFKTWQLQSSRVSRDRPQPSLPPRISQPQHTHDAHDAHDAQAASAIHPDRVANITSHASIDGGRRQQTPPNPQPQPQSSSSKRRLTPSECSQERQKKRQRGRRRASHAPPLERRASSRTPSGSRPRSGTETGYGSGRLGYHC